MIGLSLDDRHLVLATQSSHLGGEPFPEPLDRLATWFDQQLAVAVAADVEPEEVEPFSRLHDPRLVLVEGQTPWSQPPEAAP